MLPPFPVLFSKAPPTLDQLLFGNGESGFLFQDFTELNELYTTSQGPTQVSADSDPVGLALDDHSWADRTLAQQLAISPELSSNPGGPFTVTTGWTPNGATLSVVGGNLRVTSTGAGFLGQASLPFTTVVGKTYAALYTAVGGTGGGGSFRIGTAAGGTQNGVFSPGTGTFQFYFVATATTTYFTFASSTVNGEYCDFTVASAKLLDGNHGLQATSGQRPVWRTNSGKPFIHFDGSDDRLVTSYAVQASVTSAIAFNSATAGGIMQSGGNSGSGWACFICLDSSGRLGAGWGSQTQSVIFQSGGADLRNQNHVGILNADGSTVELWLDGARVYSGAAIQSGAGNAVPVAIGCHNTGSFGSFANVNVSASLVRSVKSTPAEIARINADFQRTF